MGVLALCWRAPELRSNSDSSSPVACEHSPSLPQAAVPTPTQRHRHCGTAGRLAPRRPQVCPRGGVHVGGRRCRPSHAASLPDLAVWFKRLSHLFAQASPPVAVAQGCRGQAGLHSTRWRLLAWAVYTRGTYSAVKKLPIFDVFSWESSAAPRALLSARWPAGPTRRARLNGRFHQPPLWLCFKPKKWSGVQRRSGARSAAGAPAPPRQRGLRVAKPGGNVRGTCR